MLFRSIDRAVNDITGLTLADCAEVSYPDEPQEEFDRILKILGKDKVQPTIKLSESYKQKVHRYSYPKGYKKLKHVKLFEQFEMSEGTRTIDEPVILLAIRCKSADEFKKELDAYKEEHPDSYTKDVIDAQHRLGLPLNAENDPALIYDKAKSIQA